MDFMQWKNKTNSLASMLLFKFLKLIIIKPIKAKAKLKPFPSYDNSAADDFEFILSKNGKSLLYN